MTDYEQIQALVIRERQCRVRYLKEELADCFFEDATVTTSWTKGSAAAYIEGGQKRTGAAMKEVILNRTGTPIIHQNDMRAYVELPSTTIRWLVVNGEEAVLTSFMRLLYRTECRNGLWKITDLTSINEGDMLEPAIPGVDLHIDPAELKGLRHSYRFLAYTRIKAGGQVRNDLLGIDRAEELERIYLNADNWLRGIP